MDYRSILIITRLPGGRKQHNTLSPQLSQPDEYAAHQAAAIWLRNACGIFDLVQRPWIREIVQTYAAWTSAANGAELEAYEQVDNPPREWNEAYFDLLANCLPGLASSEIDQLALNPICSLPDESFFDVIARFLRSVDAIYFGDHGLQEPIAVQIRARLANRLIASNGWKRLVDRPAS